jgi:hypothetical protein
MAKAAVAIATMGVVEVMTMMGMTTIGITTIAMTTIAIGTERRAGAVKVRAEKAVEAAAEPVPVIHLLSGRPGRR